MFPMMISQKMISMMTLFVIAVLAGWSLSDFSFTVPLYSSSIGVELLFSYDLTLLFFIASLRVIVSVTAFLYGSRILYLK